MNKKQLIVALVLLLITTPAIPKGATTQTGPKPQFTGKWFMEDLTREQRVEIVAGYLKTAKENGVTIRKSPTFYIVELYKEYDTSPQQMDYSVGAVIKTIALLYGDWQEEGKTEQQVFKETYGDGWQEMYRGALDTRKAIKELGNE